jgi:hypothetical protein
MAGLIQKQMGGSQGDESNEQEPMEGMGPDGSAQHEGMEGEAPESGDQSASPDENNPEFKSAVAYAMQVLYEQQAAKDVSKSLKAAPSVAEGMANVAYDISSIVDDKTKGAVPDELIILLGMRILEEVADIAEASGLKPSTQDVAQAFKTMLLRFLGENGMDTTQLQQAMDQVDPKAFEESQGV